MANLKQEVAVLWIVVVFFSVAITGVMSESEAAEPISDSGLNIQIDNLRSQISSLESSVSEKSRELNSKDASILQLEKTLNEKSASVVSLQSEVESLQKKGALDADKLAGKAHARAGELEKQVAKLEHEIEAQTKKKDALEEQSIVAEKKAEELNLKLGSLEKMKEDQTHKLQKMERALQVAEEELMRIQVEANSKTKLLTEIHGAWLPPWLATNIARYQDLAAKHWKEQGKPAVEVILLKVSEKSAQAQKWAEPHLETVKTKWIPAVKEKYVIVTAFVEPHVQTISTKSVEAYEVCKSTISRHTVKIQELASPYVQEARKVSKPYIDQIATITKPHVEKLRVTLKPYTNHAAHALGKFLESAKTCHQQVQDIAVEKLKNYKLTESLATKEMAWFLASASLAIPAYLLHKIFLTVFRKKARKPTRSAHANHANRKHKRRHTDK